MSKQLWEVISGYSRLMYKLILDVQTLNRFDGKWTIVQMCKLFDRRSMNHLHLQCQVVTLSTVLFWPHLHFHLFAWSNFMWTLNSSQHPLVSLITFVTSLRERQASHRLLNIFWQIARGCADYRTLIYNFHWEQKT